MRCSNSSHASPLRAPPPGLTRWTTPNPELSMSVAKSGAVDPSLDEQLRSFQRRRFVAMPIAGTIAWTLIGVAGALLEPLQAVWALYIGTGSIFYLGLLVARFTGEDLLNRSNPNTFDRLFLSTVFMSLLVFAIAIPFAGIEYTSLPLSVGILAGLMWVPLSWMLRHWVGVFHATTRTALVLAAWYVFPTQRFVVIPAVIVAIYLVTIAVLEARWRKIRVG